MLIGIDIGGTNLRGGLFDDHNLQRGGFRTESLIAAGRDAFIARLTDGIDQLRALAAKEGAEVSGIGIGVPGLIDSSGLIHSSVNMRPLEGVCLTDTVENITGLPVACANDANLAALGELEAGAGKGFSNFVVMTIGTGLGSGLILDGRLWSGSSGLASEMGHMTFEPEGRPCPCGNRGCIEQYVSAQGILKTMALLDQAAGQVERRLESVEQLAELARGDDQNARKAFRMTGEYLGTVLASVTSLLDLEAAVISGGVSASLDLMIDGIRQAVSERVFPQIGSELVIKKGMLADDAGLVGAAVHIRRRLGCAAG